MGGSKKLVWGAIHRVDRLECTLQTFTMKTVSVMPWVTRASQRLGENASLEPEPSELALHREEAWPPFKVDPVLRNPKQRRAIR